MSTDRRGLAAVLVVGAVTVALVGWPPGAMAIPSDQPSVPSAGVPLETDETLLSAEVQPDGTAVWRVEFRYRLDDDETEASFDAVRRDVEENPLNFSGPFATEMEAAAAAAEVDTGREMAIHNVTVDATRRGIPEPHGVLVFTFEWEGFAAVADDGRLRTDGTLAWMTLDQHQTLLVSWPAGYELVEVTPSPTDEREGEVVWRGPVVFGEAGPSIVVAATDGHAGSVVPVVPVVPAAALVGAVALAIAGLVVRRRRQDRGAVSVDDPDQAPVDEDLLSDEERVLRLLEDHGGRMKQQDVVETVEWSETKTSDVVQSLRDEDRIEVYRIGRENVLALPGEIDV